MTHRSGPALAALAFALLAAMPPARADARTWTVTPRGNGDAPTIQAAVDSAAAGDTILLSAGVFTGNGNHDVVILSQTKYFHFVAQDPAEGGTVIDAKNAGRAFILRSPVPGTRFATTFSGITFRRCGIGQFAAVEVGLGVAEFDHCVIEHSVTHAILGRPGSVTTLRNCAVRDNPKRAFVGSGTLTMIDCDVLRNGMPLGGAQDLTLHMERCVIAHTAGHGIYTWASDIDIVDSTIEDNDGFSVVADGALRIVGSRIERNNGPIYIEREDVWLEGNVIAGNRGGLRLDLAGGTVTRNTIVGNGVSDGVVIETTAGGQMLTNNIIAFNRGARLFDTRVADMVVRNCDIFGNTVDAMGPYEDGTGNFSADPHFCDAAAGDYHLAGDSPCLAANNPGHIDVGALGVGCPVLVPDLHVTPSAVGLRSRGVVTLMLRGVENVDAQSVRLADVAPAAVVGAGAGAGSGARGAGAANGHDNAHMPLILKFSVPELLAALAPVSPGETRAVALTARTTTGDIVRGSTEIHIAPGAGTPTGHDGDDAAADARRGAAGDRAEIGAAEVAATMGAAAPARDGINVVTPNPFNPVTRIHYGLASEGTVRLVVYDVAGRAVATLVDGVVAAGAHEATWDAVGVASGVYFARLTTPAGAFTRKLVVTK